MYVDGKLITATNGTIAGLIPGEHALKIAKKGFVDWQKKVEVFPELVTDITAILVSQTPRLEPLTNTGAKHPSISPSLSKLAYFSKDEETPGVWIIPLTNDGLSIFRSTPFAVLEDSRITKYSEGMAIHWSPDEKELLVEGSNGVFYLADLATNTAKTVTDVAAIQNEWEKTLMKKRSDFIEKLDIPEDIKEKAISQQATWAPDGKKFLYTETIGTNIQYKIYNMEKPLPVGENVESTALVTAQTSPQPGITWYSDSYHLILTEKNPQNENVMTISLLRIDGTNKTEVYNNTLYSNVVYSSPGGDKLIVLTSFKSGEQTDLYTIGIR